MLCTWRRTGSIDAAEIEEKDEEEEEEDEEEKPWKTVRRSGKRPMLENLDSIALISVSSASPCGRDAAPPMSVLLCSVRRRQSVLLLLLLLLPYGNRPREEEQSREEKRNLSFIQK